MAATYPFWEKELKTVAAFVDELSPDCPLFVTGVPSLERRFAVESVLRQKGIVYCTTICNTHSTLRDIISELSLFMARRLQLPFAAKSSSEMLLDVQEYCTTHHTQSGPVYLLVDGCEYLSDEVVDLVAKLASKVTYLGVIMLTVSIDPLSLASPFIVHLPALSDNDMEHVLSQECLPEEASLVELICKQLLLLFSTETNSLSELRTLRDITLSHCRDVGLSEKDASEVVQFIRSLRESLFTNIMPIASENSSSLHDTSSLIPLSDFCGVDISFNAKLLLIAGYLCSVYPESEDVHLFGRDESQHVKSKGRRRRKQKQIAPSTKSSLFSIHRLVALYLCLRKTLFPDMHTSSANYDLLLSQITVLLRLGLFTQVGSSNAAIELNQLFYRCAAKRSNILNIAKNVNLDLSPYI